MAMTDREAFGVWDDVVSLESLASQLESLQDKYAAAGLDPTLTNTLLQQLYHAKDAARKAKATLDALYMASV